MFVPYKPQLCFNVYRSNDSCVCEAYAISTYSEGISRGYCMVCTKKERVY